MKDFESHYNKIYKETLTHLKDDFENEKSEWRSINPFNEYRSNALDRLNEWGKYPEDVKEILPKAEMLFEKRRSIPHFVSAILIVIELKEDDFKMAIIEAIAEIKANRDFIFFLDIYTSEKEKASKIDSKSISLAIPRLVRTRDDDFTKLNQVQTAILFKYLRETKTFLGEDYLSNSDLANLIYIGTGYSAKKTRQTLSTNTKDYKREDLKEIYKICELINSHIKRDLEKNQ